MLDQNISKNEDMKRDPLSDSGCTDLTFVSSWDFFRAKLDNVSLFVSMLRRFSHEQNTAGMDLNYLALPFMWRHSMRFG